MARYNPYLFQTLNELSVVTKEGFESFLGFMGYATLILVGRGPPAECSSLAERLASTNQLQRSDALILAWLAGGTAGLYKWLKSGGLAARLECDELMKSDLKSGIGNAEKLLVKLVNDLRRTYVLEIVGDEEACREWRGGEARLTWLANVVASVSDNPIVIGSIVYIAGLALRITPAYHFLAIALGIVAASGREACKASMDEIADIFRTSTRVMRAAISIFSSRQGSKIDEKYGYLAQLLAKEVGVTCLAIDSLRNNTEILARSLLRIGMSVEILDPSLLLDTGVLAVPPKRLDKEVEACLARCAR